MVDALDLKSSIRNGVWVRTPSQVPKLYMKDKLIFISLIIAITIAVGILIHLVLKSESIEEMQIHKAVACAESFYSELEGETTIYSLEGVDGNLWCLFINKDGSTKVKSQVGSSFHKREN